MTPAIAISGLVKAYGPTRALDGLDLTVGTGEVHGFLGPNGAGKSTTIRILLGLIRATSGSARLLGGDDLDGACAILRGQDDVRDLADCSRAAFPRRDVMCVRAYRGSRMRDGHGQSAGGEHRDVRKIVADVRAFVAR